MDASCVDGGDLRARSGIRRARYRRVDLHRRQRAGAADDREMQSRRREGNCVVPWREAGVRDLRSSVPGAQRPRRARRLRHHGHRNRRGAHRSCARRRRLRHRRQVRPRSALRCGRGRHPAQRAAGVQEPAGLQGQSADRRAAEEPRRAAGLREDRALLSALLALSQSHHLPCHRAVVHLDGRQDPGRHAAQPRAGRDQEGEVGPGVGRRAHLQHDRHASGLVHLAPAHLGRAHRGIPVRRLQGISQRSCGESRGGRAVRARRR